MMPLLWFEAMLAGMRRLHGVTEEINYRQTIIEEVSMETTIEGMGNCLCGAIQIKAAAINTQVGTCHCSMCRKWGGGPMMTVDCGTAVGFEGEDYITVFDSSEWAERGFCSKCGTHLYYKLKEGGQFIMPVGLFDNEEGFKFDHQIFIDKKPSFYSFANVTNNMTEAEVFAKYSLSGQDK
jgi:hypothetical protein